MLIISQTLLLAIPLLLVALGGVFSERGGIVNLGLEGEMIFGAFCGALFVKVVQNDLSGFLPTHPQLFFIIAMIIATIGGALFSLLLSFSAIRLKADQTIGGTALNMLAPAIVCALGLVFFGQEKVVPETTNFNKLIVYGHYINDSGVEVARTIPFFISTIIGIIIYVGLALWLYKSKVGLHLRACGEHPQAAASVGIDVYKMRYLGTTISGALAGLGGYIYIVTCSGGTAEASIYGLGFLALGIMIFGNWNPIGIAGGAILFGFLKNLSVFSNSIGILKKLGLPGFFWNMLPYVIVLIVLAVGHKKSACPKAEGIPYDKGMR